MKNESLSIGILILTYNSKKFLKQSLKKVVESDLQAKILVIDSSSSDGSLEYCKSFGLEVVVIPQSEYNHGLTREKGRKLLATDIVIMLTPDAYLKDEKTLKTLIQPLEEKKASIAYARQLPHQGASFLESFPRHFNYPKNSHIRSLKDISTYGSYTFFCSNSCSAYLNSELDQIGGFPEVLFGEDTYVTALLLKQGAKIAYRAEALVYHSHRYSLKQEFQRNFDIGLSRKRDEAVIHSGFKDEKRGIIYLKALFQEAIKNHTLQLPYACFQTLVKWIGYKIGQKSIKAPKWLKRRFSSQKFYWNYSS